MFTMEITRLIERCRQGDADALGELYKAYAQRMRGVCRRYISEEQAVDDVLHDAFVIIFTSFNKLRDVSKAESWMMSITRNVASKYKDHLDNLPFVPLKEAESLVAPDEKESVRGVPLEDVLRMVERLPEGYGQVFRLSVFEGMSHKEIAAMLGIEAHSSSSQLARAKKMLRKMMQQYWAVLLLLLIPVGIWLLHRKDKPGRVGDSSKVVATADTVSSAGSVEPKVTEREPHGGSGQLTEKTPATERQAQPSTVKPSPLNNQEYAQRITGGQTTATESSTVEPSPLNNQEYAQHTPGGQTTTTDSSTVKPSPLNSRGYAQRTSGWSVDLAYAGQLSEQSRYNQPYTYRPAPSATQSLPGPSPSPVVPSSIDNWMDYAVYLANHPDAVSDKTRSIIMRIAKNNANEPGNNKMLRTSHHRMPVTWSLALKYKFNDRWGIETGLGYSRLTSDFEMGVDGNVISEQQTIHYLGIPVKGIYHIFNKKMWSLYGSGGLMMEIPVSSTLRSDYFVNGQYETTDKTTIRAPWQWSVGTGLGLQYHLTPAIGLFAEPSLQYYIPTGSYIETYRTEHPFSFSLPLGIRFTW
ncbi:MAG: sigma-70 family RNA polymerase sigma factor [Prevotella sp.]|nr:sigma-70 family RNA polymerase sigma factor [Prevotella sp.]